MTEDGPVLPSNLYAGAIHLANEVHRCQEDKAGFPYILHVLRVGLAGANDRERIVGWLHDVVEDGGPDYLKYLQSRHFPSDVIDAVEALTCRKGENYEDYLVRVKANPLARAVKLNDLSDNLREDRVVVLSDSLVRRYRRARKFLLEDTGED